MCENYISGIDRCKYCEFKWNEEYTKDDWDIFKLDDEYEWSHRQIMYRLHAKGVECILADIYCDENIAYLIGCYESASKIANALNIHEDTVYNGSDNGLVIINLFYEKYLRSISDEVGFMEVLDKYGITDPKKLDQILLNERVW